MCEYFQFYAIRKIRFALILDNSRLKIYNNLIVICTIRLFLITLLDKVDFECYL